jgi:hypothetical protein
MVRAAPICVIAMSAAFAGCQVKPVVFSSDLKMSDSSSAKQLIAGFHTVENGQWRWTARRFSVVLQPPAGSMTSGAVLRLKLFIPEPSIRNLGPMTLSADVGEVTLAPETFTRPGSLSYSRDVPPSLFGPNLLPVVFYFDKALAPLDTDGRELAAVVSEVSLEPKSKL